MALLTCQRPDAADAIVPDWAVRPNRFNTTEYSLGNKEIDDEHHHIFGLLNSLDFAESSGEGAAQADLLLKHLCVYLHMHFEHEERLMDEHGYPRRAEHKQDHSACRAKLRGMIAMVNANGMHAVDCAPFVREWLHNHLLGSDRELASWLEQSAVH